MAKTIVTNLYDMVSGASTAYIYANKEEFKSVTPGPQGPRGFRGEDGTDGESVVITSVLNNPNKSLTINFSDGTQHTTDPLKGQDGTSITITNVVNNANGTMLINFSDGTSHHTADLRGPRGFKGDMGDRVHHISYQRSKDSLGNDIGPVEPGSSGNSDVYAMWMSQEELPEMFIGEFVVYNGKKAFQYAIESGYLGTEEEFYLELANVRYYYEQVEVKAASVDSKSTQVTADALQVATDRVVVEESRDITVEARDVAVMSSSIVQSIFLGPKSVDPTVDNEGNALIVGTMYYNTVSGTLRIWTGVEWTLGAFSAAGAVVSFNGRDGVVTLQNGDITTAVGKNLTDAIKYSEADKVLSDVNKVSLSTDTNIVAGVGELTWNQDESTVDIGLNGATLQVGQEQLIRVRNSTGSVITNGSAVMATGTVGNSGRITVGPANLTSANAKFILGVTTQDISAGDDGFCTTFGKVRGINTTGSVYGEAWADGDVLYVKENGNGALTKVEPTNAQVKLPVAIVIHTHSSGTLFVRVNSIDENHAKAELALKANSADVFTKAESNTNYEPKNSNIQAHVSSSSNPHGVTKAQIGLGNVDNTSDANKPISTATQTALNLKAPLASPSLTGVPVAPTASVGTSTTQLATTEYVANEINKIEEW